MRTQSCPSSAGGLRGSDQTDAHRPCRVTSDGGGELDGRFLDYLLDYKSQRPPWSR